MPELVLKAPHLILAPDDAHSRMRRTLSHAFSTAAVKEQEYLMTVHFDKMIDRIKEQASKASDHCIDMEKMYNCVAFDIIGDLAFGESFGALDQYEYHEYMIGVFMNLKVFSMFQRLSVYKWALKLAGMLMSVIPAAVKGRAKHFKFAAERVEARMARQTERKDFMWYILKHNGMDGRGLSQEEINSNSGLLIGAGSETTATALTGATYYLLTNPQVLATLTKEVRSAFASSSEITISTASRLPYLVAVMEEAMRLYPPGPAANVRVTNHETEIDGHLVPAGTRVAVQQWTTHRSKSNFHDPMSFLPERWLADADPKFATDKREAVNPFSYGPRNCLGKSLAYAEMYSIMARVIFNFDMRLGAATREWLDQRAFIFWEKGPLWVEITKTM